jgi:sugar phosphate isomerase/epimerase
MISRREFLLSVPLAAALPGLLRAADGSSPRPQVGCQVNAYPIEPGDFDELLKRAAELKRMGYEGFECNYRFVEGKFRNTAEARAQIESTGMKFYGPHVALQQAPDSLARCVDGAAALGASHLAVSGPARGVAAEDGKLDEDAMTKKAEAVTHLATLCRKAGLRLTYHNHTEEFRAGGAEIEALLQRTEPDLVSLLVDLGHAWRVHADVVAFFSRHHARIAAMHLRDIRAGEQVPLGQGEIDFPALAAIVRRTGWSGWLTNEEEGLHKGKELSALAAILQSDRDTIRKLFAV